MNENRICDPWLLEQEKEEKYIDSAIKWAIQEVNIPYNNPEIILGNKGPYYRYVKIAPDTPHNGGHDFGLPINKKENNDRNSN